MFCDEAWETGNGAFLFMGSASPRAETPSRLPAYLVASQAKTILFDVGRKHGILSYRSSCLMRADHDRVQVPESSRLPLEPVMPDTTDQGYHATRALRSRRIAKTAASAPIAAIHNELAELHQELAGAENSKRETDSNKSIRFHGKTFANTLLP
jgi:hypothetical protein